MVPPSDEDTTSTEDEDPLTRKKTSQPLFPQPVQKGRTKSTAMSSKQKKEDKEFAQLMKEGDKIAAEYKARVDKEISLQPPPLKVIAPEGAAEQRKVPNLHDIWVRRKALETEKAKGVASEEAQAAQAAEDRELKELMRAQRESIQTHEEHQQRLRAAFCGATSSEQQPMPAASVSPATQQARAAQVQRDNEAFAEELSTMLNESTPDSSFLHDAHTSSATKEVIDVDALPSSEGQDACSASVPPQTQVADAHTSSGPPETEVVNASSSFAPTETEGREVPTESALVDAQAETTSTEPHLKGKEVDELVSTQVMTPSSTLSLTSSLVFDPQDWRR